MIDRTVTALTMAALATPAVAHSGAHDEVAASEFVHHIVGSPFHVFGIGAALGIAGLVVHRMRKRRQTRQEMTKLHGPRR